MTIAPYIAYLRGKYGELYRAAALVPLGPGYCAIAQFRDDK